MSKFVLKTDHKPAGDQPKAIEALVKGVRAGMKHQTLLGVTGSGKTFTAANVIEQIQKPTLVIAHNKTLAAQLAQEYRDFFPDNAVHYFVSYYDYYQPEAYMPTSDTYIEKEAQINEEIERLRHASTQALLTRKDVIIVASVSCIYGLGSPAEYEKIHKKIEKGFAITRAELIRMLVAMYFERTNADLSPGEFRAVGNFVEIMPVNERIIYRISFDGERVGGITAIDAITREIRAHDVETFYLFPAKHFVTPEEERTEIIKGIEAELKGQLEKFKEAGKLLEAERLRRRTQYDIAMMREVGYCNGIENYSRHFDRRSPGEPPYTLLSYFPHVQCPQCQGETLTLGEEGGGRGKSCSVCGGKGEVADFLTVIDESHVTISQLAGMYAGDRSRKETLVEHGFRLPCAIDNRPLNFDEVEYNLGQRIYTSATPGKYEYEHSKGRDGQVVEQIIRPTGLVDPLIEIRPVTEQLFQGPALEMVSGGESEENYKGQVRDFIEDAVAVIAGGGRVLTTTLTKQMAEDLAEFLRERNIKAEYIHSDIKTLDRIMILTNFRKGVFDCLVGVNLLREGLDLPEVELVSILDADKEGFLRSETSLIQTIGRAARNVKGRVVLYADQMTGSLTKAIEETNRRREIQIAYNTEHGITPQTVQKAIRDITAELSTEHQKAVHALMTIEQELFLENPKAFIKDKVRQMNEAVAVLDFETAALLRDEIALLEEKLPQQKKKTLRKRG